MSQLFIGLFCGVGIMTSVNLLYWHPQIVELERDRDAVRNQCEAFMEQSKTQLAKVKVECDKVFQDYIALVKTLPTESELRKKGEL